MNRTIKTIVAVIINAALIISCSNDTQIKYWDNGNIQSSLTYDDGILNGKSTWYYKNGNKEQEVIYKNNKLEGPLTRWFQNGSYILQDLEALMLY